MVGCRNTVQFPTVCSSESFDGQVFSYLLKTVPGYFIALYSLSLFNLPSLSHLLLLLSS